MEPKCEFKIDTVDDGLYLKTTDAGEPYLVLNGKLYERIKPPVFGDEIIIETNGDGVPVESIKVIHKLG